MSTASPATRPIIPLLILFSGFAALSWEMLWQIKSTLALGISAQGAAITLAATMGGMSIGGFLMGWWLQKTSPVPALKIYGLLEIILGVAGLFLEAAFRVVEKLDTQVYAAAAAAAPLVHIVAILVVLGVPAICMGATLPVFGLIARRFELSLAGLYGLNTLGAAAGVLCAALVLIPRLGVLHTIWLIAVMNIVIGLIACTLNRGVIRAPVLPELETTTPSPVSRSQSLIVLVTGFATFTLEIAWFRSLAGTFSSTTDMFAVMLAAMLIALGLAARSVAWLKRTQKSLGLILACAGILILLATPLIERFDLYYNYVAFHLSRNYTGLLSDPSLAGVFYIITTLMIFLATCCVIGPPVWFLGVAFPWILSDAHSSRSVGKLYAINTLAAIAGSLGAAWIFLPSIGFARTSWIVGVLVAVAGIAVASRRRLTLAICGIGALLVAMMFESGIGSVRVQGFFFLLGKTPPKVLEFYNGPDAAVSVIEYFDGARRLLIDSDSATGESGPVVKMHEHYMNWMGHLPMLLAPNPGNALVICFGTGQTANAVRRENPQSLDIVDVNPRIFKLAHNFRSNEGVLNDARVKAIAMDGRAFMRRSRKDYDVITLEPMPPTNAGVNALYSREFYEAARERLTPHGVIAQWLPFHSVAPFYAASIVRTFTEVFPNAILWIDAEAPSNAILLGTKDDADTAFGTNWPGFARNSLARDLSEDAVRAGIALNAGELKRYGAYGAVISDDNQLLAYGNALHGHATSMNDNYEMLHRVNENIPPFMPVNDTPAPGK